VRFAFCAKQNRIASFYSFLVSATQAGRDIERNARQ
jgi:hypothetical protein